MKVHTKFENYDIVDVWNDPSPELAGRIVDLWTRNKALPAAELPEERVKQVVVVAVNQEGDVVGVNTVYSSKFPFKAPPEKQEDCYLYRMFIESKHRVPHMMRVMTNSAFDILQGSRKEGDPKIFVIITENPGLKGPGMLKMFERHGYKIWFRRPSGELVLRRDFAVQ